MFTKEKQGFTLIEILIVVAIIAILASVVLVGLGPTQQAGRDARRLSDIHQVQNGLELYYNKCGYYPGTMSAAGVCGNAAVANGAAPTAFNAMGAALTVAASNLGINTIPNDPSNSGTHFYYYRTTGASATSYLLVTVLENTNSNVFTSYTALTAAQIATYGSGDTMPASACGSPAYCITL